MIFVDTGAFLARHIEADEHHEAGVRGWRRLAAKGEPCSTSNFVLDEAFTLLARRAEYSFAVERARSMYASQVLTILRPTQDDELVSIDFFEKFADQEVSFTDCVSFALMLRTRMRRAFSFDRHFRHAGFEVWP